MNRTAADFLTRCFAPGETIALLLRRENPPPRPQRIVALEQALEPRYLAWLTHENNSGANIYVAANPLRPGSRKRTKESIASIRHLYIDIDTDGDARLAALRASDRRANAGGDSLDISRQISGALAGRWLRLRAQEQTLKLLAIAFGGDPACTDCNRVLRIPGFLNRKYYPAHLVAVEYPADSVYGPADFRLDDSRRLFRAAAARERTEIATRQALPFRGRIGPGFATSLHTAKMPRS